MGTHPASGGPGNTVKKWGKPRSASTPAGSGEWCFYLLSHSRQRVWTHDAEWSPDSSLASWLQGLRPEPGSHFWTRVSDSKEQSGFKSLNAKGQFQGQVSKDPELSQRGAEAPTVEEKNKKRLKRETGSIQPITGEMRGERVSSLYHFTVGWGTVTASVLDIGNPKNGSPVPARDDAVTKLQRTMCHWHSPSELTATSPRPPEIRAEVLGNSPVRPIEVFNGFAFSIRNVFGYL